MTLGRLCLLSIALLAAACATAAPASPSPAHAPNAAAPPSQAQSSQASVPRCAGEPGLSLPPLASEPSTALIVRLGTGVSAYERMDAVWLKDAPIAVNREFDFATAMTLEGVGAGLAAAKRKRENEEAAALLSGVTLGDRARQAFDALRACGIHAYAVLFGPADAAELRVGADRFTSDGKLTAHAVLKQDTRPLAGEDGWTTGHSLERALLKAFAELPAALKPYPPDDPPQPRPGPPKPLPAP